MPEGPSIVILKELLQPFAGKEIVAVDGNTKAFDKDLLLHKKVTSFKSWGKHTLICFDDFTVKIHFLLFGSYLINERKEGQLRLGLTFPNGEVNFYACQVKLLEEDLDSIYDWSSDLMNDSWNAKAAAKKVKAKPNEMICDTLLDQDIFGGLGNIIKNEILYRVKVQPESRNEKIPAAKMKRLIEEARIYSFEFLEWKKNHVLRKHWLAHTKKVCARCNGPITLKYTGFRKRRSFFCEHCQKLYE
jgi:endonuclease VIII